MWRNKTVQVLIRDHARREQALQQQTKDLLDRLMHMAGTPWAVPPVEFEVPQAEQPEQLVYADQIFDLD